MARDGSVTLHFGDGERAFRLRIGALFELQDKINRPRLGIMHAAGIENPQPIGPRTMLELLARGDMWPHEIREILRIGLVGGGMKPVQAELLLQQQFAYYSIGEASLMAAEVLSAATAGEERMPVGKGEAAVEAAPAESPQPTGSTSATSMDQESSSGSMLAQSTISPFPNMPQ